MSAVVANDIAAVRRVIHPASLACIDDSNRDFFDFILANEVRDRPGASSYRITRIGPATGIADSLVPPGMFRYPVQPTHEVQIDFQRGPNRSTTVIRQIARSGASWFEVLPCPTPDGLEAFRRRQSERRSP